MRAREYTYAVLEDVKKIVLRLSIYFYFYFFLL